MKLTITINCDNAAFEPDEDGAVDSNEVARILRKAAERWDDFYLEPASSGILHDANGNRVGQWTFA